MEIKRGSFQDCLHRIVLGATLSAGLFTFPSSAQADPLDETDGTEIWDQVVQPAAAPTQQAKPTQDSFNREIAEWERIRINWEQVREGYLMERAAHKRLASRMRAMSRGTRNMEINDSNVDRATAPDAEWGDAPGEQRLVPTSAVDRAIDDELSESSPAAPAPGPAPSAAPPAVLEHPPEVLSGGSTPSAFKQHEQKMAPSGGIAPTSANPNAPMPPPPPKADRKPTSSDDGAKVAAELMRKQEQEERKRKAAEQAQAQKEADEGAAAAAEMLKMQAQREREEQERLRKKADLNVDDDGQVVDPELQREMDEDE
jgi:hypothetical protein